MYYYKVLWEKVSPGSRRNPCILLLAELLGISL